MKHSTTRPASQTPPHAAERYEATVMFAIGFFFFPVTVLAALQVWIVAVIGTLAILALRVWRGSAHIPLRAPLPILLASVIVWGFITWFWSIAPDHTIYTAIRLVMVALCLVVLTDTAAHLDTSRRKRFGVWLVAGTVAGLLLTAAMIVTNGEFAGWLGMEVQRGHELDRLNRTSGVIAILVWPVALVVAKMLGRWIAALVIALAALALFSLSPSTPVLAFVAGAGAFAVAWMSPIWAMRLLLIAFAASIAMVPLLDQIVPTMNEFLIANISAPNSEVHRFVIWRFAAERILEHPLLGWGMDSARAIPGGDTELFLFQVGEDVTTGPALPLHPHNALIQIWLELGLVGLLLAGGLFALAVSSISQRPGNRAGPAACAAAIASALAIAQLSFGIWQGWWMSTLGLVAVVVIATTWTGSHYGQT